MSDNKIEIYPGGSCTDVVSIVSKAGLWEKISTRISLSGVIDADFRDDDYLSSLASSFVHALGLHEAESYLCVPEIICAIAGRIGSQESTLIPSEVESHILNMLERDILQIAAKRLFARSKITLAVSVEKKTLVVAATRDELVNAIKTAAENELGKATAMTSTSTIESAFDAEVATIHSLIQERNVIGALRYLPSKELLNSLAPRAGCKNGTDLMRALRRNFSPADFELTKALTLAIEPAIPT